MLLAIPDIQKCEQGFSARSFLLHIFNSGYVFIKDGIVALKKVSLTAEKWTSAGISTKAVGRHKYLKGSLDLKPNKFLFIVHSSDTHLFLKPFFHIPEYSCVKVF